MSYDRRPTAESLGDEVKEPYDHEIHRKDSKVAGTISVVPAEELEQAEAIISAEHEFTKAEYKRLLLKVDFVLIPLLMIVYGLQYSDKTSLAAGVIFGLKEDTHITAQEYNNLNSFFYMSYAIAQFPMGWIMQRFPLGKALSVSVVIWGTMVMLLGACNHYWDLSIVRVLLGWFEAVVTPGFAVLTSSWYLRKEQTLRQGCYYAMNSLFGIVFGVGIYYIALNAQKSGGLAAWRVINLFLGGTTVGMGIIFFFMVGTPDEVWWLSKREKLMAKARIAANATGGGERHPWRWSQVRECFRDPQYWHACAFNFLACIPNGGLGAFNSLLFKSMGFNSLETILFGMPAQGITFVCVVSAAVTIRYFQKARFPLAIMFQIVACISFLYTGLEDPTKKWKRWAAFSFYGTYSVSTFGIWPLMSVNVAGRTKKTFVAASCLVWYCIGNIIGTQIFIPKDAPRYLHGLITCGVVIGVNCINLALWWLHYIRTNRKRERAFIESGINDEVREHELRLAGETDLSDMENLHFRYSC